MGRLIDADALIELLDKDIKMTENFINKIGLPSEKALKHYAELASQLNTLKSYKGIIQQQPTAYDVRKVVIELDRMRNDSFHKCDGGITYNAYTKAIEMVRKGDIDG